MLEGPEREQSGESVPGAQPADTGGPDPLNATTTVEGGSNATNATNATTTGDAGTTAGNQTVGGPLPYMVVVEAANRAATFEHIFTESGEYPTSAYYIQTWSEQSA